MTENGVPKPEAAPEGGAPEAKSPKTYGRIKDFLVANATVLAAVITAGMFVIIIGSLFWPYIRVSGTPGSTLLHELSNTEVARGLITFLVAVATVGIALILTVYAVSTADPKAKENFALAKEVLTSLIGVLGTIVGFYFGSTMTNPGTQQETPKGVQQEAPKGVQQEAPKGAQQGGAPAISK